MSRMRKLQRKQCEKPKKKLTKKFLIKQIQSLRKIERTLDRYIRQLDSKGVKDTDYVDIMNALHEYNEIRDAVSEIFKLCCEADALTSAQLHIKYEIPLE